MPYNEYVVDKQRLVQLMYAGNSKKITLEEMRGMCAARRAEERRAAECVRNSCRPSLGDVWTRASVHQSVPLKETPTAPRPLAGMLVTTERIMETMQSIGNDDDDDACEEPVDETEQSVKSGADHGPSTACAVESHAAEDEPRPLLAQPEPDCAGDVEESDDIDDDEIGFDTDEDETKYIMDKLDMLSIAHERNPKSNSTKQEIAAFIAFMTDFKEDPHPPHLEHLKLGVRSSIVRLAEGTYKAFVYALLRILGNSYAHVMEEMKANRTSYKRSLLYLRKTWATGVKRRFLKKCPKGANGFVFPPVARSPVKPRRPRRRKQNRRSGVAAKNVAFDMDVFQGLACDSSGAMLRALSPLPNSDLFSADFWSPAEANGESTAVLQEDNALMESLVATLNSPGTPSTVHANPHTPNEFCSSLSVGETASSLSFASQASSVRAGMDLSIELDCDDVFLPSPDLRDCFGVLDNTE
jgi:hypothetical protein